MNRNYPKRDFIRTVLRTIGRSLLPLFADVKTESLDLLPRKGPAIFAGNHENIIEVVLLPVYSPVAVEFIGSGDVPIDPRFAWLAKLYGFIPIKRGNIDRSAIYAALKVLREGGVIGIFPQGGIWGAEVSEGRSGVALLSYLSGAPVYPIGFGGLKGAMRKIASFRRPRLTMRAGSPLHMMPSNNTPPKEQLLSFTNLVMEKIRELLPSDEQEPYRKIIENFTVEIRVQNDGLPWREVEGLNPEIRSGLGLLFHYPVLLDTFSRNLKLPVHPLQRFGQPVKGSDVKRAAKAILNYLEHENNGFFTYRFGVAKGLTIKNAIVQLAGLAEEYKEANFIFEPVYEYSQDGKFFSFKGKDSLYR